MRASFTLGAPSFSVSLGAQRAEGRIGAAIGRRVALAKRTLKSGGLLQPVEWLRRTGTPDVRGRQDKTTTPIDVYIQSSQGLDRDRLSTDRTDSTLVVVLDPVAIKDSDTFRWGGDAYKIKQISGLVKDERSGVRFYSEVLLIL